MNVTICMLRQFAMNIRLTKRTALVWFYYFLQAKDRDNITLFSILLDFNRIAGRVARYSVALCGVSHH